MCISPTTSKFVSFTPDHFIPSRKSSYGAIDITNQLKYLNSIKAINFKRKRLLFNIAYLFKTSKSIAKRIAQNIKQKTHISNTLRKSTCNNHSFYYLHNKGSCFASVVLNVRRERSNIIVCLRKWQLLEISFL